GRVPCCVETVHTAGLSGNLQGLAQPAPQPGPSSPSPPRRDLTAAHPWSNSEHFRCCPTTCRPLRDTLDGGEPTVQPWFGTKRGEHAQMSDMSRREFIALLGGAVVAWPLAARAQQSERMRRIGVLTGLPADNPQPLARNAAFLQGLGELGWNIGRNLQIDYRLGAVDARRRYAYAAELVALTPEVILAVGSSVVGPLLAATRSVPVVFVQVTDPVGAGYVHSLARPRA